MNRFIPALAAAAVAGAAQAQEAPRDINNMPIAGAPAVIPIEITGAPLIATSGELKPGAVVAQHTVVVRGAVVLTSEARGKGRAIPAGTALAQALVAPDERYARGEDVLPTAPAEQVWCDVRPTGRWSFGRFDCFQDADGDGRFDKTFTGVAQTDYYSLSLSLLKPEDVPVSGSYRPARPEERPSSLVGYRYCGGDNLAGPPRFSSAVPIFQSGWEAGPIGGCAFGVWPDPADKSIVEVDRIRLRVTGTAPALRYEALNRIEPRRLARITPGEAVRSPEELPSTEQTVETLVKELTRAPLVARGAPVVAAGAIRRGDAIVTAPVAHGVTGVLKNEVKPLGLFARGALPAGQPVYGVPMVGTGEAGVVWCAPKSSTEGGKTRWSAICLPQADGVYRWVAAGPALFVRGLTFGQGTSAAQAPSVEEKPVDIAGPMTLAYRFIEWDEQDADVEVRLLVGGEDMWIGGLSLKRAEDGAATLKTLGGEVRLRPVGNDRRAAVVEVVEAPRADGRVVL